MKSLVRTIICTASFCLLLVSPAYLKAQGTEASATVPVLARNGSENSRPRIYVAESIPQRKATSNETNATIAGSRDAERRAFDLINKLRVQSGAKELKWNRKVAEVARSHSQNMALHNFFSHRGTRGELVDERASDNGVDDWRAIGENIAYLRGFDDPAAYAVERWMMSVSHRQNLLDPRWTESGIGLAITEDGTYYFTQVFIFE